MMNRAILCAVAALAGTVLGHTSAEDLSCLTAEQRESRSLYSRLQDEAYAALDGRDLAYEQLKTPEQIRARQSRLREFFVQQLGGFPNPSPLNARTVSTIPADGYTIECVIFDSQPKHRITANLYLPAADGPVPGVVVSSGHSRTAKTADYNQRFGIVMVRNGMAALCFDPIGQGERSQILDDSGNAFLGTTTEHFLIGVGSTLVGRSTARYRIWDAMRAIDYLESRPEIDSQRIGMTGCSGGGTLTSYVMALDERVVCAAPACYLTTFRRLIETIGPQDAEQNVYGQIAFGLDHPDYVLMRAPKPTLISSTTADFFDIGGSWDNYREAKRTYGRLGSPERVDLVEIEGKHGVKPQNLATIAHWMKRWLLERDEPVDAVEIPVREASELLCTETGQVLTSLSGERSVFELNAHLADQLTKQRKRIWEQSPRTEVVSKIRGLLSVRPDEELTPPEHRFVGRIDRDGYHIDKSILQPDAKVPLPTLTFHPPSPTDDDAYLYLHDEGMLGDSGPGGGVEELVGQGYAVVTVDLRGQGETSTGRRDERLTDWKTYYLAYLLGKPLIGLRVEDTLIAADYVAFYQRKKDDPRKVHLVANGQTGIVALHAVALRPLRFASVELRGAPRDWSSMVRNTMPSGQLDSVVHGALELYDLPDLVRLIGEDRVRFD